jgi:pimeloyl-ACP methyl ester carboxylesterase
METFTADDGETLHLSVSGSGAPLIMLHGWTSSHTVWASQLAALKLVPGPGHRVFRPDARGHGGHSLSGTPTPDVARLARDLLNLLDHFGLEKAAVVGHSMGALTLWQFIRDHGCQRLSHLCIIDQSPKLVTDATWPHGIYGDFDAARSQALLDALEIDFAETVLRLAAHGLNDRARAAYERASPGWNQSRRDLRRLHPPPLIAIWKSLVAADYRDVLPRIDLPTLLVWGTESNFYTAATAQYLLDHIANARLNLYFGADHCPQLMQPERFANELILISSVTRLRREAHLETKSP